MSGDRSKRIAELNDQLRARVGVPVFGCDVPGKIMMTSGVANLAPEILIDVWFAVQRFDAFNADNDPFQEHDFGSIEINGAGKIFWKIDYYVDALCVHGSETPEDPMRSFRVLTIMLAGEY